MAHKPEAKALAAKIAPDAVSEMDSMIGLDSVKDEFKSMIAVAKYRQALKEKGLDTKATSLNQVFEGEPGTGKSVVARQFGRALGESGMLKGNEAGEHPFIEVSPNTLKGQYRGHTTKNMQDAFDQARGGVLFIDEANAWANPSDEYGVEAMSTLMKLTEDNREDVVVALGGYPGLRNALQRVDPGLPRRFPSMVEFPPYSPSEKVQIGRKMLSDNHLKLTPKTAKEYSGLIARIPGQGGDVENFNGFVTKSVALRRSKAKDPASFDLHKVTSQDLRYAADRYRDKYGRTIEEAWNEDHPGEPHPKLVGGRRRPLKSSKERKRSR